MFISINIRFREKFLHSFWIFTGNTKTCSVSCINMVNISVLLNNSYNTENSLNGLNSSSFYSFSSFFCVAQSFLIELYLLCCLYLFLVRRTSNVRRQLSIFKQALTRTSDFVQVQLVSSIYYTSIYFVLIKNAKLVLD